jgi:predicted RNA-binding Zn ribbon-like protein
MAPNGRASKSGLLTAAGPGLCLAYANTLTWRGSEAPSESLPDLAALLAWIEKQAGLDAGALDALRASPDATRLFAEAIALREAIYRIFESVAAGASPGDADFAALSDALAAAPPRTRLERRGEGYAWRIPVPDASAPQVLAPVLWAAADLLVDAGRRRIRQCANEKCLWLFVDESKSGTRRWCDMTSCGNRAKAQRHYAKAKRA